jgi:mono/diheme cytochrome c family protein
VSAARTALGVLVLLAACGTARRGEPLAGQLENTAAGPEVEHGKLVFFRYCHKCHPGGEAGLGPAINDKPLPSFLVRFQVRNGLGAMPSFDDARLPDPELDALLEYVAALRRHGE